MSEEAHRETLYGEKAAREILGGIGHTTFYKLLRDGDLKGVKIGKRRFIRSTELDRFISELPREKEPEPTVNDDGVIVDAELLDPGEE